jgi:colicin import membrane protein
VREKQAQERKRQEEQQRVERERKLREDQARQERERMDRMARRELDDMERRKIQDQLAAESAQLAKDNTRREAAARSSADASLTEAWKARIAAKIRGNIVLPDSIPGNPEAVFDVVQLPSGDVISVKLRKSSGVRAYDEAVERAIVKSAPLPKPDRPALFERELRLSFRPMDN